jgi:integrase-like protein
MSDDASYLYQKTVKGKRYVYFRWPPDVRKLGNCAPPSGLTPLPNEGSAEFRHAVEFCMQAVRRARKEGPPPTPGAMINERVAFLPGSIGRAIEVYLGSLAFAATRASTQSQYRHTLDQIRARIGTATLSALDTDAVDHYSEKIAKELGTSVADRHVLLLRNIWKVTRKEPEFKLKGLVNPTIEAERRHEFKRAHRPWPQEVQDRFMANAPAHLKLAKLVLHFAAQRGGDSIKLLWSDYDGRGLIVRPEKDRRSEFEPLPNYHLCPKPLRDALDAAPRVAETILVNGSGQPYASADVLSAAIRRVLRANGDGKRGRRGFVMHGLRKSAARDVGSLGLGPSAIKTIGGWRSDATAKYYAEEYDRRRVNALAVAAWDAALEAQQQETSARATEVVKRQRAQIRRVK